MIFRVVMWAMVGGVIGGIVGYLGKGAGGACPLTCNPVGGILVGALLGVLLSAGSGRPRESEAGESVSADQFEKALAADKVVLADFYANWCGPCRKLKKVIDEIEREYSNSVNVVRIDVDRERELARNYAVSSIPDVRIYANGEMVERFVGMKRKKHYVNAIRDAFEKVKTEDSEQKTEGQDA